MSSRLEHSPSLRRERNFKRLQLAASPLSIPVPPLGPAADAAAAHRLPSPASRPSRPSHPSQPSQPSHLSQSARPCPPSRGATPRPPPPAASESFFEGPSDDEEECPAPPRRTPPRLAVPHSLLSAANAPPACEDEAAQDVHGANSALTSLPRKPLGGLQRRPPPGLKLDLTPEVPGDALDEYAISMYGLASGTASSYDNRLSEQLASLRLQRAQRGDANSAIVLSNADLEHLSGLGAGNGGVVTKVRHIPTNRCMAKKEVFIDAKPAVRKQILRELQIMHECDSPYIINFFGVFLDEPCIYMCMEFMDKGSLDQIYRKRGPIPFRICARVADVVAHGLSYLYDVHHIMHRDVKPSNILANSQGELKICDFGVSGELANTLSIANTFVGTSIYMAPERISGGEYSIKSDVWSLGISLIELALGHFPVSTEDGEGTQLFADSNPTIPMGILDLLHHIVNEPSPALPDTAEIRLRTLTDACVLKDPRERPSPKELLQFPLITLASATSREVAAWLASGKS